MGYFYCNGLLVSLVSCTMYNKIKSLSISLFFLLRRDMSERQDEINKKREKTIERQEKQKRQTEDTVMFPLLKYL